MAEDFSTAEMVIPGTFIRVRADALIGAGGVSTGNIGIVGTAAPIAVPSKVPLAPRRWPLSHTPSVAPMNAPKPSAVFALGVYPQSSFTLR